MSLFLLPNDILVYIFKILSILDRSSLLFLDKTQFFKNLIKNDYNSVIKIQKFYKNNLPRVPLLQHYNTTYNSLYTKNLLIRMYIASYPMNFLIKFPETYIESIKKTQTTPFGNLPEFNSDLILDELTNWIKNNLPNSIYTRSRRDIKRFLNHPKVTKAGINYCGW